MAETQIPASGSDVAELLPTPGPILVVISGPSGVGKDAVVRKMKERGGTRYYAITATTRPPRDMETDGIHYHFYPPARFQEMRDKGELLEWAQVYGHFYGVPKAEVQLGLSPASGGDVIVKTDVQGASTIKDLIPEALLIFITPSSLEELTKRLKGRRTESPEDLALRLKTALAEMKRIPIFDYVVVNREGCLEEAVNQVEAIILAEKCRTKPRVVNLKGI